MLPSPSVPPAGQRAATARAREGPGRRNPPHAAPCSRRPRRQIMVLRGKFHEAPHDIPGDPCEDCVCAVFCGWCVIQQCARHLHATPGARGDAYLFAPPRVPNHMDSVKPV